MDSPLASNSAAPGRAAATPATAPASADPNATTSLRGTLRRGGPGTVRYLLTIDAHTFAFSVAANAVLSFFPFVVLMLTITRRLDHFLVKHFHVQNAAPLRTVVLDLLRDYLPIAQDFVVRNLDYLARARKGVQAVSVVMLLITSTGIFLPLEVALNRIWGFPENRSYVRNQMVSLGLCVTCVVLALLSVAFTAGNQQLLQTLLLGSDGLLFQIVALLVRKLFAIFTSIAVFFLIYWLLPNGKVPAGAVAPAAVITGLTWELCRYLYILCLPLLNFQEVYGPFTISVTLIFWAFLSGLLLLAGAHLSVGNAYRRR